MNRRSFLRFLGIGAGAAVVAPAVVAPALLDAPTTPTNAGLWRGGELDHGTLDLGIRRDFGVGARNEYTFFAENFAGFCAPSAPYYSFGALETGIIHDPVIDSLPKLAFTRSPVRYTLPE